MTVPPSLPVPDPASSAALAFARDGSTDALGEALSACADAAFTQARRLLRSEADAEDAVQDAFIVLARSARRYDGSIPFGAWVSRQVHFSCIDQLRRRRSHGASETSVVHLIAPEPASPHPDAERVAVVVRSLPERLRSVVDLHYFGGLSQIDTASAMGITISAVAVRLHRAREILRKRLTGGASSEAGIVALLVAQPHFPAAAGLRELIASPAIPSLLRRAHQTLMQKAWSTMMRHPFHALASTLAITLVVVVALHGEDHHATTTSPPTGASANPSDRTPAAPLAWTGAARDLLPFIDPAATCSMGVDFEAMRRLSMQAKPTSVFGDPALQATLAHIRKQLEAVRRLPNDDQQLPVIFAMFDQGRGAVISKVGDAPPTLLADCAEAVRIMKETLARAAPDAATRDVHRYAFALTGAMPLGLGDQRMVIADPASVEAALSRVDRHTIPVGLPPEPLWMVLDGQSLLKRVQAVWPSLIATAPADPAQAQSAHASLSLGVTPLPDGWHARMQAHGLDVPLRPCDIRSLGAIPTGRIARVVVGCDPRAIAKLVLTHSDGAVADAVIHLMAACSGDIAVTIDPGLPIPSLCLIASLTDVAAADAVIAQIMTSHGGARVGDHGRWSIATAFGAFTVSIADHRLVVTNADLAGDQARAAALTDTNQVMSATIDLAAVAQIALPLLYARVSDRSYVLGDFLPRSLRAMTTSELGQRQMGKPAMNLQAAAEAFCAPETPASRILVGDGSEESRVASFGQSFAQFETDDANAEGPDGARWQGYRVSTVCRLDGGYAVDSNSFLRGPNGEISMILDGAWGPMRLVSLAEAQQGLQEKDRLWGPGLADLRPLTTVPTFDRRCLPDIQAFIRHLPLQRLSAAITDHDMVITEDGLPLVTWFLVAMPVIIEDFVHQRSGPAQGPDHPQAAERTHREF